MTWQSMLDCCLVGVQTPQSVAQLTYIAGSFMCILKLSLDGDRANSILWNLWNFKIINIKIIICTRRVREWGQIYAREQTHFIICHLPNNESILLLSKFLHNSLLFCRSVSLHVHKVTWHLSGSKCFLECCHTNMQPLLPLVPQRQPGAETVPWPSSSALWIFICHCLEVQNTHYAVLDLLK